MIRTDVFFLYLLVMAGVTYLIRALPLVLCREKIENRFIRSFLYYIPYAVLSAMTIPAIFYSTGYLISALLGLAVAVILSFMEKKLLTVAIGACCTVFIVECVMKFLV
ncbi:MAG: AzlD domain-containing protein [Clostridiales bacterium]|nr:AzlD domain-containing protein [Clostridiales bacterium]